MGYDRAMTSWVALPMLLALALATPVAAGPLDDLVEYRAQAALRSGHPAQAAGLYARLRGYRAAMGRGISAYRLGRFDAAREDFALALELAETTGEHASAAYDLGNTLARLGDHEAARRAYRQALRWQPEHAHAKRNLSLLAEADATGAGPDEHPRSATVRTDERAPVDTGDVAGTAASRSARSRLRAESDGDRATRIGRALDRWRDRLLSETATLSGLRTATGDRDLEEALYRLGSIRTRPDVVLRHRIGQAEARLGIALPDEMPPW